MKIRLPLLTATRTWGVKWRASNWFTVFVVTFAVFTDIFLYGVIVPVIPFALEYRADIEVDRVQYWVSVLLAVYGAGLLVFSPICGWFSDTVSMRRLPLLLGLAALLGATVMLNVATSVAVFVVGRLLQGISAAVVWVVGLALLADTVPREMLAQYMGYVSLGMTSGFMLGPLLGGVLYERTGYNGVWALCYAFIGMDFVLRIVLVEKKDLSQDLPVEPEHEPETKEPTRIEDNSPPADESVQSSTPRRPARKTFTQKLPAVFTLLASRRLLAALFASIVQATLVASFDSVLPLFVNEVFSWGSLQSGILYLTIVIPTLISPLVGFLGDKYGGRWFAGAGFLLACPMFILLRLITHNTIGQKVSLVVLLVFIGLAMTLSFPVIMAEITHIVAAKEQSRPLGSFGKGGAYAQAYGLFNMAFAAGTLIGPVWAGMIKQNYGWGTATWTLGLLSGVTVVPCVIWVDGSIRKRRIKRADLRGREEVS
ncbi:MFS amine transporter, putative [Talaromyces stipitatus ATCC 10500]|uniref:MFS amine transporter, putative n=1 Tax=Talaromyces stipitatus (strain ATCC 10500 / CBS 375.48 / QM 6759 / NRRL 1006) TaxID=441959 RepID=B8MMX8_TALSN|nr:MFS amine transporter, putative [Talaromyces stipitatus ATCC 10500]EED13927.1 MFS amine transporter, putative [Talaromyces stipitatus ATCC 10500]